MIKSRWGKGKELIPLSPFQKQVDKMVKREQQRTKEVMNKVNPQTSIDEIVQKAKTAKENK